MRQGEIYWASLDPVVGNEQGGKRPVVIISGDTMNEYLGVVMVCPLSSKIKNYPGTVVIKKNTLNRLKADSEIIVFQLRSVSSKRLSKKIGEISRVDLYKVMSILGEVLQY